MILSDEVYEHLVFDGQQHFSALHFPELRERSFVIGSFGKTFHVTGWKRVTASLHRTDAFIPPDLSICEFLWYDSCQIALAQYMEQHPEHIQELSQFYQTKRDRFNQAIHNSRFY